MGRRITKSDAWGEVVGGILSAGRKYQICVIAKRPARPFSKRSLATQLRLWSTRPIREQTFKGSSPRYSYLGMLMNGNLQATYAYCFVSLIGSEWQVRYLGDQSPRPSIILLAPKKQNVNDYRCTNTNNTNKPYRSMPQPMQRPSWVRRQPLGIPVSFHFFGLSWASPSHQNRRGAKSKQLFSACQPPSYEPIVLTVPSALAVTRYFAAGPHRRSRAGTLFLKSSDHFFEPLAYCWTESPVGPAVARYWPE